MAVWRSKPAPGLIHHSDRGVQYTALSFSERLREMGITPSMGRTGTALDNAMVESFVSTLKAELVSGLEFPTRQAAKTAIFEYLARTKGVRIAPGRLRVLLGGCASRASWGAPRSTRSRGVPPLARTRLPYATLASSIPSSSKSAGLL